MRKWWVRDIMQHLQNLSDSRKACSPTAAPSQALHAFRDNKASLLVATPAAARGLDLPAVQVIVCSTGSLPSEKVVLASVHLYKPFNLPPETHCCGQWQMQCLCSNGPDVHNRTFEQGLRPADSSAQALQPSQLHTAAICSAPC